mmetsp:Transcript_16549/g.32340  ORF Transcript_16549/g.32340 Transcript_16549/m.32340 type:complete len:204 (+) Transcript_16549:223-834(+)
MARNKRCDATAIVGAGVLLGLRGYFIDRAVNHGLNSCQFGIRRSRTKPISYKDRISGIVDAGDGAVVNQHLALGLNARFEGRLDSAQILQEIPGHSGGGARATSKDTKPKDRPCGIYVPEDSLHKTWCGCREDPGTLDGTSTPALLYPAQKGVKARPDRNATVICHGVWICRHLDQHVEVDSFKFAIFVDVLASYSHKGLIQV